MGQQSRFGLLERRRIARRLLRRRPPRPRPVQCLHRRYRRDL